MPPGTPRSDAPERDPKGRDQAIRQFVGFRLDDEDYAIPITRIREIILMKPITRLPQVPDAIEGLINLRGNVIPIINLRKRFGLTPRPFDDETRTIVVTVEDKIVGCIVDEVTQVMRISGDQIQPVPISMAAVSRRFVSGLAKLEDRLLIILDTDKLFGLNEFDLDSASVSQSASTHTPERPPENGA